MAATGYTPISLYYSTTASAVPTAGNLANGELALNIADMKLYAKNSSGVVTLLASNASTTGVDSLSFGSTGLTPSTATTGAITVAGTLNVANGGTGLTSLTAGYIPYGNGTSAFASSSSLFFDGTNLGIGTSSPASKLDVRGNAYIGVGANTGGFGTANKTLVVSAGGYNENLTAALTLTGGSGNNNTPSGWSIQSVASGTNSALVNTLLFGTTSYTGSVDAFSEKMRIDSAGNLGLGVTPSAWYSSYKALQVKTSALAAWGNNEVYLMSNAYGDTSSTYRYLATGSKATSYVQYEGTHLWNTAGTGTAGDAISFTQVFEINATGAIGVGSSPSYGTSGQVLTSAGSGSAPTWTTLNALPSQTGNAGKYLTTDGSNASWATVSGGATKGQAIAFSLVFGF